MRRKAASKVRCMPITKARVNLGSVVRRVHLNKEYVILEKGGIPVAGIMDADELEDYLELQDSEVRNQIEKSNEDIRAGRTRPAAEFLAELLNRSSSKAGNSRRRKR